MTLSGLTLPSTGGFIIPVERERRNAMLSLPRQEGGDDDVHGAEEGGHYTDPAG